MKTKLSTSTLTIAVLILLMVSLTAMNFRTKRAFDGNAALSDVLQQLGEKAPDHYRKNPSAELIEKGRLLIVEGKAIGPNGKMSRKISRFFNCTNCHNNTIEDPDLTQSNPETRLDFVIAQNKPLLPASTFYGIVNRTSWYNDDYLLKYGKLVEPARNNLINSMQLCATECSQGRKMEDWEVEAILAYYYSIEFKLSDLKLTNDELDQVNDALAGADQNQKDEAIKLLRSKFYNASPATFVNAGDKTVRKYGENGNAENGKKIYTHSCMSCHKSVGGVTNFKFDMEKVTFRTLQRNLKKNNHFSVYYMARKGTYAVPGYKPYMPNFSLQRLSHQQLEDLVAFINQQAK